MKVIKVSWDRLTIVCDVKNEFAFQNLINSAIHVNLISYTQTSAKGTFLNDLVYFEFDSQRSKSLDVPAMRLDFNPNKLNEDHWHILKQDILPIFGNKHLSRADLAFDLDSDLSRLNVASKVLTSTKKYYSRSGKLETLYLGSRRSSKQLRMYDKKAEREAKDDDSLSAYENYWRIEFQLRHEAINDWQDILDSYDFVDELDLTKVKNLSDRGLVIGLIQSLISFNDIEKGKERERIRREYKKVMTSNNDVKILLQEALKKEAPRLVSQLEELLNTKEFNQIIS